MANIKSQIKRNRQNEKRRMRNKAVKSALKTAIRKFNERLATDPRLRSVIVPMRDGVAIALVVR